MSVHVPRTEQINPQSNGLDMLSSADALQVLWRGQMTAIKSVKNAIPALSDAGDAIAGWLTRPRARLIYAGAGSSGMLAMQDGKEMNPTFNWPENRLLFLMAEGEQPGNAIIGRMEDDTGAAETDFYRAGITNDDIIIAVAASGTTPYTVRILQLAREAGALRVAIANNEGADLLNLSDHPVLLDSGPEVITGSTRMGAGTAQKAALGMLSSLVMMRLGHVVDGWMVSMATDNIKLLDRARRIVGEIADCPADRARDALETAGGNLKTAVLIAMGADAETAEKLLTQSSGQLRAAMNNLTPSQ